MSKKTIRLLTNISSIIIPSLPEIYLNCCALVLQEQRDTGTHLIRGFGASGYAEHFQLRLKCHHLAYEVTHVQGSTHARLSGLNCGRVLTWKDGTAITIGPEDGQAELDVSDHDDISRVWQQLPVNILKYWQAPYFPTHVSVPRSHVSEYLGSNPW